jgi:hypothetical protein
VACAGLRDVQRRLDLAPYGVARLAPGGPSQGRARRRSRASGATGATLIPGPGLWNSAANPVETVWRFNVVAFGPPIAGLCLYLSDHGRGLRSADI